MVAVGLLADRMSQFEWFLFFWIGMASVQCVIVLSMILYHLVTTLIKKRWTFKGGFFYVTSILMVLAVVIVFWPVALYMKRLRYFRFPTKEDYEFAVKFLNRDAGSREPPV